MTRKMIFAGLTTLVLACVPMLFVSVPASAAIVHEYEREINGSETPAGLLLFLPLGVAVDNWASLSPSANGVYAADFEDGVVDKFGLLGKYESQLTGFGNPFGVAIDNSVSLSTEGGLYVADFGSGDVYKDSSSSICASGFHNPSGVAVDQATGDVYVADGGSGIVTNDKTVYKYDSTCKLLTELKTFGSEGFTRATAVAVDNTCYYAGLTGSACTSAHPSNGDLYVLDDGGDTATDHVDKFDSEGKPLLQWPGQGFGLAVNQSTGDVYATNEIRKLVDGSFVEEFSVEEFDSTGKPLSQIGEISPKYPKQQRTKQFHPASVAINRVTGEIYVADGSNGVVDVFGPPLESPEAFTGPPLNLMPTSVTLDGEVNPKHGDTTSFFEYGSCAKSTCTNEKDEPEAYSSIQSTTPPDNGSGAASVSVEAVVSALVPNQVYHYLLVAENKSGPSQERIEKQFTTPAIPPEVETSSPSFVGFETSALSGSVNPEHSDTEYHYEYGQCVEPTACSTSNYTNVTPIQKSAIYGAVDASQEIGGLRPSSTYHYRLVAESQACPQGKTSPCPVYGSEETFTTEHAPVLIVVTGSTSGATQSAAVISGTLDPNGLASNYGFQIGTQAGTYGPEVGTGTLELGVFEARTVTFALQNLQPSMTYHYRLLASNSYNGTVYGTDQTFTTIGVPSPFTQPLAPPLLATPPIGFPTKPKEIKCKRGYKLDKHRKCVKAKTKKKIKSKKKRK